MIALFETNEMCVNPLDHIVNILCQLQSLLIYSMGKRMLHGDRDDGDGRRETASLCYLSQAISELKGSNTIVIRESQVRLTSKEMATS